MADNKSVRRSLPLNGRLHIDRPLPFICVYRHPVKAKDEGTEKLVKGEASYLTFSSSSKIQKDISSLLQNIISLIANDHSAYLIIEIWSKRTKVNNSEEDLSINNPGLKLKISKEKFHTETVEALQKGLSSIFIQRQKLNVEVVYSKRQCPENLPSLLSSSFLKKNNCFIIGLELEPFYRHQESGEVFPFVLRKLHQGISKAIKLGVFQFSHHQTKLRPTNYQALGRRAMVKAVWEVDQKLAEISNAYDFLLLVTPINIDQSWNRFKRNKFEKSPSFNYRPIPINPSSLKMSLYNIPLEKIEDPTLLNLFYEKQVEIERTLSMLRDRRTKSFFYGSMQLYGEIDNGLKNIALDILGNTSAHSHSSIVKNYYDVHSFAERAEKEVEYYKSLYPGLSNRVEIREDITGLMVSKGNLLLGAKIKIPEARVEALLQHEIGTHMLTFINGKAQPFQQLYTGLAGYDELQEGIAVLSEYLVGGLTVARLRLLAGRVMAASFLIDGASFIETFRELNKKFEFPQRISYIITSRIYRGGGLTKDAVYLRGLVKVLKYFEEGGEIEPLLIGKISSEHVPIVKELQARKVLEPIKLLPRYLQDKDAAKKLNKLKNGITILDLIKRS